MTRKKIYVLIVDDHSGIRREVRALLEKHEEFIIAGEARTGEEALAMLKDRHPDIVLLDVELPILSGMAVAQEIQKMDTKIRTIAMSTYHDPQLVIGMMRNGASGFLSKDSLAEELVPALKEVVRRTHGWIGLKPYLNDDNTTATLPTLTQREYQILRALNEDHSIDEIAAMLEVSAEVVDRYIRTLFVKYEVDSVETLLKASTFGGASSKS